jgi:hypothetical protein
MFNNLNASGETDASNQFVSLVTKLSGSDYYNSGLGVYDKWVGY